jgi:hypothetical protein
MIFKDEVGLHVLQAGQDSEANIIHVLVVSPEFHEISNIIGHTLIIKNLINFVVYIDIKMCSNIYYKIKQAKYYEQIRRNNHTNAISGQY